MASRRPQGFSSPVTGVGIGLRAPHYRDVLVERPDVAFLEVHSENYFGAGGLPLAVLDRVRGDYPVSLHGVGLSLGATDPIDVRHLGKLRALADRVQPVFVSDHLSWSSVDGRYLNDLLPLPYTEESLAHFCRRVDAVQSALGRPILIENPSTYLELAASGIPEAEFLAEVALRTGSGILLDVNNVYVSATNHGRDARRYIDAMPAHAVGEIHLAGFTRRETDAGVVLVDTHDHLVADDVWALYAYALRRIGPVPTLVEWDSDLPPLATLVAEAKSAERLLEDRDARAA
jgi:uncharacterized protein (UPF0276 family)